MDLKNFLLDVFPDKCEDTYTKMFDNLKRLGFDSVSDMKYLDEEAVKELESFTCIEIRLLKKKLANCDNSDHYNKIMREKEVHKSKLIPALCEIFIGTDMNRILEIEKTLKSHEITAKKDLIYIDVDKFRKEKILSEIEVLKIVTFLEENYKVQYNKIKDTMELEKSKELRHVMNKIFVGTSTNRLEKIEQILIEAEIYSGRDVLFSDLNSFHLKESLSNYEMSKLEDYIKEKNVVLYKKLMSDRELEKSKNLKSVLKQIFVNTPEDRLAEIEVILKEEQIYSGLHMKIIDTNSLRRKKSLSEVEILKIEEYIRKYNRDRYEDIKSIKMAETEIKSARLKMEDEFEFYALKKKKEIKFMKLKSQMEQKMIEFKAEEKRLLRENRKELMKANADMESGKFNSQKEKQLIKAETKEELSMNTSSEVNENSLDSLINEKKGLWDDVKILKIECINLWPFVLQAEGGILGPLKKHHIKKKDVYDEYEENKNCLKSKYDRLTEIEKELKEKQHSKMRCSFFHKEKQY